MCSQNMHTLMERPASFAILPEDKSSVSGKSASSWLMEVVYTKKHLFRMKKLWFSEMLSVQGRLYSDHGNHLQVRREDQWS